MCGIYAMEVIVTEGYQGSSLGGSWGAHDPPCFVLLKDILADEQ